MYGRKRKGVKEKSRTPPGESRAAGPIPAPGDLQVVQAFLNTVQFETGKDELATPRDLADWLSRNGLLPAGSELAAADLGRARDARAGLRALFTAQAGEVDEQAMSRLDRAAAGARAQVRFDRDGTTRLEHVSRDFDDALGTLLGLVHAARCAGQWPAFKICAHSRCRNAFYDFTKSCNGKWCSRRCGDKVRAKTFRRKQQRY
ncbi:MAG: CGNR zinc finger domain-containing protein [Acidobacteriota bacterium]